MTKACDVFLNTVEMLAGQKILTDLSNVVNDYLRFHKLGENAITSRMITQRRGSKIECLNVILH